MIEVVITTNKSIWPYDAETGQEAVQMFFDEIRSGNIELSELGFIGSWHDGENDYPFRIGPALFKCGLLNYEDLLATFEREGLDFTSDQVSQMIQADAWMVRQDLDAESLTVQ